MYTYYSGDGLGAAWIRCEQDQVMGRELSWVGVTANGRKLSRSDQPFSEADKGLELSELSKPGISTLESLLVCGLWGRFRWVGVECRLGLKLAWLGVLGSDTEVLSRLLLLMLRLPSSCQGWMEC